MMYFGLPLMGELWTRTEWRQNRVISQMHSARGRWLSTTAKYRALALKASPIGPPGVEPGNGNFAFVTT